MQKKTCQAYRPPPHVLSELIVEKGYEEVMMQDVIDRANVGIEPDRFQLLKNERGRYARPRCERIQRHLAIKAIDRSGSALQGR